MPQTGVILLLGMVLAHSCQVWDPGVSCLGWGLPHPGGSTSSIASCVLEVVMFHQLWCLE